MDRRLLLTIVLALGVFIVWSSLVTKLHLIENKGVEVKQAPQLILPPKPELPEAPKQEPEDFFATKQSKHDLVFVQSDGSLHDVSFPQYKGYKFLLGKGFLLKDQPLIFSKVESGENKIIFKAQDINKQIIKRFIFSNNNYDLWLEIEVVNISNVSQNLRLALQLGNLEFSNAEEARYKDVTLLLQDQDKIVRLNGRKDSSFSKIKFVGWRDRYFCVIVEPEDKAWAFSIEKKDNKESLLNLFKGDLVLDPGQRTVSKFHIYLGPQDLKSISSANSEWVSILHYGTFDFISQLLVQLLAWIYKLVHNWGLTIIVLSVLIYFILYPLSLKQMRSMKEMQILQPKIEELKITYKDNPQKLNKAIMDLYKEHKVNPFGGCLPLLLQIPIFFALYQVLIRSVALKGASFLWIKDLSEPDRLFILPFQLPILANEINILPILMIIGMFFQQKISMAKNMSGASAEQQKLMLILMPLMFGLFFYRMPSGLVLYWFVNSTLMLIYQLKVNANS